MELVKQEPHSYPSIENAMFSEINLNLAIPYVGRVNKKSESTKRSSVIKICDENINRVLQIETTSPRGGLSASTYDVLVVLLDICCRQIASLESLGREYDPERLKVVFTYRELCERLDLNVNNSRRLIKDGLENLAKMQVKVKGHIFNLKTFDYRGVDTFFPIVHEISRNTVKDETRNDQYNSVRYVIFNKFIIDLLGKDFVLNRQEYLRCKSGKERRAYTFLMSKRGIFGDIFSFDIQEIAGVIGDSEKRADNMKKSVTTSLDGIKAKIPGFSYAMKNQYGTKMTEVLVEFNSETILLAQQFNDEVYKEYVFSYGATEMESIGFGEKDYISLKRRLKKKLEGTSFSESVKYREADIDTSDFIIDLALFQILKTNYTKMTINQLTMLISKNPDPDLVQYPERYRLFLHDRNKELRKKIDQEKIQREKNKRERDEALKKEREEEGFSIIYKDVMLSNEKLMAKYEKKAREILDDSGEFDEFDGAIRESLEKAKLADLIREVAKNDYYEDGGKILSEYMDTNSKEFDFTELVAGNISDNSEPTNFLEMQNDESFRDQQDLLM